MDIPSTCICPICFQYKPQEGQWGLTEFGDAVCRSCLAAFPELKGDVFRSDIPENCPICQEYMARTQAQVIKPWVKGPRFYMCPQCAKREPQLGDYRQDMRAREFIVIGKGIAQFTFGLAEQPDISFPSLEVSFKAQERRMWATVSCYMKLVHSQVKRFENRFQDALYDVSIDALMRASVMMMHNCEGNFRGYALVAIRNSIMSRMKKFNAASASEIEVENESMLDALSVERKESNEDGLMSYELLSLLRDVLTKDDMLLLQDVYLHNLTLEEVGRKEGVIKQAISNRLARIRVKCQLRLSQHQEQKRIAAQRIGLRSNLK